jgi:16S rRNA (guanine1207-N2)-methyltransferase
MSLSAAVSVLRPDGTILLYGAKDEGIQPAMDLVAEVCSGTETIAVGARCRVLRGDGVRAGPRAGGSLEDWKAILTLDYSDLPPAWASYPGVFSHGRLDEGTRLLLDSLPPFPPGARILDYGCGTGVVGYVARARGGELLLEMLDVDAVALEAARENVPASRLHLLDGLPPKEHGPFDAILSNPPFHRGKAEDPQMIVSLIQRAPALLDPEGMLVFVAQRRLALVEALQKHFRDVDILAEDSTFRVWKGLKPRKERRR